MKIAILAPGSRGDLEPYIALGKALLAAGHTVHLLTHENFETMVTSHGLEFFPIKGSVQDIAQGAEMSALIEKGNFLAIMAKMAKEAQSGALTMAAGGLAACQGMDLILAGIGGIYVGIFLAEKLGIPFLQAYYIPFTPTRTYPSFIAPGLPARAGALNPLTYQVARQTMWQGFRSADRQARKSLGIQPAPMLGPFSSPALRGLPVLNGYSPAVIPPAPDWGDRVRVTGYWFLEPPADWTPPPALEEFLQAGPPPVYVGFGSMSSRKPEETAELVFAALKQAGQRAILLSGWSGLRAADVPPGVFMVESVPFQWLFPRMAAVVHHGGAGTTAAGLRAGVPSIVVPFFGDQPFWGRRVYDLGAGPRPIPRRQLTVERLALALRTAVTDESIRGHAAALGAKIRTEDGPRAAVEIIETLKW